MSTCEHKARRIGTVVLLSVAFVSSCSKAPQANKYYVSLGDSYSVGYQPPPTAGATSGYTAAVAKATHLTLANFGCGGSTTASILYTKGCSFPFGPTAVTDAVHYSSQSQAAAARAFIESHKGNIGLITVSIGGNDLTKCATAPSPVSCAIAALATITTNINTLVSQLRTAAGPGVPLIGLTYPDVLLGLWVYPPGKANTGLATLSATVFKSYINPALAKAYRQAGGSFVDITAATDAYAPLSHTVLLEPYGTIPVAVARVCELTWYCSEGNIHANTDGYALIGAQIAGAYSKLHHA